MPVLRGRLTTRAGTGHGPYQESISNIVTLRVTARILVTAGLPRERRLSSTACMDRARPPATMPEQLRSIAGGRATLLVALITGLVAAFTRLLWLGSSPPGFSLAEARAALAARDL